MLAQTTRSDGGSKHGRNQQQGFDQHQQQMQNQSEPEPLHTQGSGIACSSITTSLLVNALLTGNLGNTEVPSGRLDVHIQLWYFLNMLQTLLE